MKVSRGEQKLISLCFDCSDWRIVWCCICEGCHSCCHRCIKSCELNSKIWPDSCWNTINMWFLCKYCWCFNFSKCCSTWWRTFFSEIYFIISDQWISDCCTSINGNLVLITSGSCVWMTIVVWTSLNWCSKLSHCSWRHNNFRHIFNADCWCESRCWKWNDYHNVMNSSWLRYMILLQ